MHTKKRKQRWSFAAIPRNVIDSDSYRSLSGTAVKLLVELAYQFKGRNNGDLTVAYSILRNRGFNSKTTITKVTNELIEANLIVRTRLGQFMNPGDKTSLYGLTWLPIDECEGKHLNIEPRATPLRKFSIENKNPSPQRGPSSVQKPGRDRPRGSDGRYVSVQKQDLCME